MEPVIKFKSYSIEKLLYTKEKIELNPSVEFVDGKAMELNLEQGISEDLKYGKIKINIKLIEENRNANIILEVAGEFEINNIDDKNTIEDFLIVNGTAIVYPYVRSIVSMVSNMDSKDAIILPTINTTGFVE